jgi:uncharacterized protein YidB (DUF937 family)
MAERVGCSGDSEGYSSNFSKMGSGCDQFVDRSGPKSSDHANQLGSALGSDILKTLAARSGLSEQELTSQLSKILPGVVDRLTPNGRLPTETEIFRSG